MRRKKKTKRLYQRGRRWYADLRDYGDVGGRQEALIPSGLSRASTDLDEATQLLANRLKELTELRATRRTTGLRRLVTLGEFAREHLELKAESEDVTDKTLIADEKNLAAALDYFGAHRPLTGIRPRDVMRWQTWLRRTRRARGGSKLAGSTLRHYLNSLSNLYRTAAQEEVVPANYNPVAAIKTKPKNADPEAKWFEVHDAALILEAARLHRHERPYQAYPYIYPLVASWLLTGGRKSEILGLEAEDVSFDRRIIMFRTNQWRRLKTRRSNRTVPLWPQLAEILGQYLTQRPPAQLLFSANDDDRMVGDVDKTLDAIASRLGWRAGDIRAKMFRQTYTAARLQTLDRGEPISVYTVARELGHTSVAMVERVYARLGMMRHRAEVVEYRVEQWTDQVGDRVAELRVQEF